MHAAAAIVALAAASWQPLPHVRTPTARQAPFVARRAAQVQLQAEDEYDVVVIGAGIGGLSAAAAIASRGLTVAVCESHDAPGGAAHSWNVKGFEFESGPSLYAGLSPDHSPNPLKVP